MNKPAVASSPVSSAPPGEGYVLSDNLARCCMPAEYKDPGRKLAWANSICVLFLAVGLFGLKAPEIVVRPPTPASVEVVPLVFAPAPERPSTTEQLHPLPAELTDNLSDVPQVTTVVAAANAAEVRFPVPVQALVPLAPATRYVPPQPIAAAPTAPTPVKLNPSTLRDGGVYPAPSYPPIALRNRQQGTVQIYIVVAPAGTIVEARVQQSSGFISLDDAALDVVKRRWHFPPGGERHLIWPCVFQLQ